ncbi:MAG TPA: class II fructose-bisphosphate aldolase [Candidatus Lokiarchaeia archaeon]|nr:class II fructose-bisphosphate aldolase [Candidatus Lokiarchaeia archaeon]
MPFVQTAELVQKAYEGHYAVPAFCAWNAEMVDVILQTAERLRSPVIILSAWVDFTLIEPSLFKKLASVVMDKYTIPAAIHLDHGRSMQEAKDCIAANYGGIMVDCSARPYEENAQTLREAVELAKPYGISVEGEIGHVGRLDESTPEGADTASLSDPEEVAQYVQETGIDMVAVSIGNVHGAFKGLPKLDFDLLQAIRDTVSVPLVLHGGSGTPEEELKQCIELGISKVNVATEIVKCIRESILEQWGSERNLWIPLAFSEAIKGVPEILEKWIRKLNSENQV